VYSGAERSVFNDFGLKAKNQGDALAAWIDEHDLLDDTVRAQLWW
jgi:hypothetical protein